MRILLIILCFSTHAFAQVDLPTPPNTSQVITCFPDTAGYAVITVGPVGRDYSSLQQAIDAAQPGTVLLLDAGATFNGGFILPEKTGEGWIILMSSRMDLLPADETRIQPAAPTGNASYPTQADAMPRIVTNNSSGIPCFRTQAGAHHYRFVGLEITADLSVENSYGLVNLGDGSAAQNTLEEVPHHFVVDRCYIHGHSEATIMKYGIRLDCANAAVIDCHISDFHSVGFDAQAISGINGPGPFKILNNYLEASGENILFGGAAPAIPGLVPSDIEIRQNHFYKPWSWRVGDPSYSGKHWTVKNLLELKTGTRVWIDGNVLENSWADLPIGQSGYAILLTIRTENGNAPQADVSDVWISNNIIRHAGAGISISGRDGGQGNRSKRILISNNLLDDINGPAYGDQNIAGPNDGTFLQIGEPENVVVDHNTVFQSGPITWAYKVMNGFVFTNNLCSSAVSAGGYQGIYGPGVAQGNATLAHYFPDITDANQRFHKNVLIGGNSAKYTNYNTLSQNYFPANIAAVGCQDFTGGVSDFHGYALAATSPFYQAAADGKDIGVEADSLDAAFSAGRGCSAVSAVKEQSGGRKILIYPNPARDLLHIEAPDLVGQVYSLRDVLGRTVLSGVIPTERFEMRTGGLIPGVYVFSVAAGGERGRPVLVTIVQKG